MPTAFQDPPTNLSRSALHPDRCGSLSGLLREQEKDVLQAHEEAGLTLDFRLRLGDWSVLVLKRSKRKPAAAEANRRFL